MTALASDYLRSIIKRQVDERGIVVWYDPECHYLEFVKSLDLPGTPRERYDEDGSFFFLRRRIDRLLAQPDSPRLVLYVPLDRSKTHNALAKESRADLIQLAEQHQSGFWAELPEVQARWSLIAVAGHVLLEADRVEKELRSSHDSARSIFDAYVSGQSPWMLLDSFYRNMEKRFHDFDLDIEDNQEDLINRARQRYMDATSKMLEGFLRLYQKDSFHIPGVLRQADIFEKHVKSALSEGKTAYIWADALRFEMARELLQSLTSEFQGEIMPAIASAPTITEIGMASLLPGASAGQVIRASEGKLALEIEGTIIRDRAERVRFLQDKTKAKLFEADLDSLLPKPQRKVSKAIQDADLVLITSQEIDSLCENDNISFARTFMNDLLSRLQKAVRNLSRLGVKKIILTADHGYLFGEELGADMSIDPPGGGQYCRPAQAGMDWPGWYF